MNHAIQQRKFEARRDIARRLSTLYTNAESLGLRETAKELKLALDIIGWEIADLVEQMKDDPRFDRYGNKPEPGNHHQTIHGIIGVTGHQGVAGPPGIPASVPVGVNPNPGLKLAGTAHHTPTHAKWDAFQGKDSSWADIEHDAATHKFPPMHPKCMICVKRADKMAGLG